MLIRLVYALGVCIITIILCAIIGTLLVTANVGAGAFIHDNAGLIGILVGILWFIWGPWPERRL